MEEKMTLLTYFDGTIAWLSLSWSIHEWMSRHRLIVLPLMCFPLVLLALVPLYLMRPGLRHTLKEIEQRRINGWQIVVMSATEDNWICQKLMLWWFIIHKVTISKLELRPKESTTLEFKLSLVKKYEPDRVLDDEKEVINFLCKCLSATSGFDDYTLSSNGNHGLVLGLNHFMAYSELHSV